MKAKIHIGTSGYQYDHWKGVFYPDDLPKKEWLGYYAGHFDTVEINNTFYGMPKAEIFDAWRAAVPEAFCFILKYSRYGTHMKKLKDPQNHLAYFLERANHLKGQLGPILVQLPPNWHKDPERLEGFLKAAPKECRWAFEMRDPDWLCEDVYGILLNHNAAFVIHDLIPYHPREVTANWAYYRFHGKNYNGSYTNKQLDKVAAQIKDHISNNLEVFSYFNNDAEGHAVKNARTLIEKIDLLMAGD